MSVPDVNKKIKKWGAVTMLLSFKRRTDVPVLSHKNKVTWRFTLAPTVHNPFPCHLILRAFLKFTGSELFWYHWSAFGFN